MGSITIIYSKLLRRRRRTVTFESVSHTNTQFPYHCLPKLHFHGWIHCFYYYYYYYMEIYKWEKLTYEMWISLWFLPMVVAGFSFEGSTCYKKYNGGVHLSPIQSHTQRNTEVKGHSTHLWPIHSHLQISLSMPLKILLSSMTTCGSTCTWVHENL